MKYILYMYMGQLIKSASCNTCIVSSGKKYAELHPKKEEKKGKEKSAKEEKPKQEKPKQEKAKKQEKETEEEDDVPREPKAKDPYAGLPKRYYILLKYQGVCYQLCSFNLQCSKLQPF